MKENKDIKEANKKLYEISQYEALRRQAKMIKLQKCSVTIDVKQKYRKKVIQVV